MTGWKEIASYLGKTVRTVQRWEGELGLPVRRIGSGRGETVYAFVEELDLWLEAGHGARTRNHAVQADDATTPPEGAAFNAASSSQGKRLEQFDQASAPPPPQRRPRVMAAALVGAFILGTALIVFLVAPSVLSPQDGVPASDTPASYSRDGNLLTVFDAAGRPLWQHRSPFDLNENAYASSRQKSPVLFEDLNADGRVEVLFTALGMTFGDDTLYCFEADGTQRFAWKYQGVKHFGAATYAAPWVLSQVFVDRSGPGGAVIWAVILHAPWFPSALLKLDASGRVAAEFWNDGYIQAVTRSRLGGRDVFLVGGANNEFRSGFLAVVDREGLSATAPALNSYYRCLDCPSGAPLRYLLFPRSAVSRELDSVSGTNRIAVDEAGQALVAIESFGGRWRDDTEDTAAEALYTFDPNLTPIGGETVISYRQFYRRLQLEGHFPRPYSEEDERELWPLREWNGSDFVPLPPPQR